MAELVLGILLLVVTFAGSLVVGLRASAPIEQVRRRQAEFTADASHELRTPLSVIEAEVDLALSRPRDGESYRRTLETVASGGTRLRSIVGDLLWLARADGDVPDPVAAGPVDLADVARSCVDRVHPRGRGRRGGTAPSTPARTGPAVSGPGRRPRAPGRGAGRQRLSLRGPGRDGRGSRWAGPATGSP